MSGVVLTSISAYKPTRLSHFTEGSIMVESSESLVEFTASIVSAYVSNNTLAATEVNQLIKTTYSALVKLGARDPQQKSLLKPAVPIHKSVTLDAIICLEDGKPYQSLRRHLRKHGMTPDQYREKWGLPPDYPMASLAYLERRSALAKSMNFGGAKVVGGPPSETHSALHLAAEE